MGFCEGENSDKRRGDEIRSVGFVFTSAIAKPKFLEGLILVIIDYWRREKPVKLKQEHAAS